MAWVGPEDFVKAGAHESHTEGLVDQLRRIQGARVAAFVRMRDRDGAPECKVSLRSTDGTVDVAAIASLQGGGGHVRAAGFTSGMAVSEVMDWIESELKARP